MTVQSKIITSNIVLAVLVTAVLAFKTDTFPGNGFFFMLGGVAALGGLACLALGLLLFIKKYKTAAKGYFTSGAILLTLFLACYFLIDKY